MQNAPNWQLNFSRVPHLDLELLHASTITHDYPPHMHEEYSIGVVLRGTETTICRSSSHRACRGDVVLINAEQVHSNKSLATEYRVFKVRPKTLEGLVREAGGGSPDFPKLVVSDPLLFQALLYLHRKLEHNGSALEQESEFISTMALLLKRQTSGGLELLSSRVQREKSNIAAVRDYLWVNYAENVSLSRLAALTTLSPFHMLRVFHNRTGFPPHEFQTQVRIAHARRLIRRGMPLSQTAVETGFFDQSHLARNFKRIVGVTPRQYFRHQGPLEG